MAITSEAGTGKPRDSRIPRIPDKALLACVIIFGALAPLAFVGLSYGLWKGDPIIITPWTAGEALVYTGTISAAAIAVAGVFYTIKMNTKAQEQQLREAAAPYFGVVFLEQKNKRTPLLELPQEGTKDHSQSKNLEYKEVDDRRAYAFLGDQITYQNGLTKEQQKAVSSALITEEMASGVVTHSVNPVIFIPLHLKNIGGGSATGVRVGINKPEEDWAGVCCWTIEKGEHCYLGIYIDTSIESVLGKYELRLVYSDCLGYQYMQKYAIDVVMQKQGSALRPAVRMEFVGSRELISCSERGKYLASLSDAIDNQVASLQ